MALYRGRPVVRVEAGLKYVCAYRGWLANIIVLHVHIRYIELVRLEAFIIRLVWI